MRKIVSFIIGCLIGGIIGSYQIKAWAKEPIGLDEMSQVQIEDATKYLNDKNVSVPHEVKEVCEECGVRYGICPEILEAICWVESRYKANVESGNCKGIMQVNAKIHRKRMEKLGVTDIYDIDGNIQIGTDCLKAFYNMSGDLVTALNNYNGQNTSNVTDYSTEVINIASCLDKGGEMD